MQGIYTVSYTHLLQAAFVAGAKQILVSDPVDIRLELAKKSGATMVVNPKKEDIYQVAKKYFGSDGPDMVFDCVGNEITLDTAINLARKGSKIIMVGVPEGKIPVNMAYVQDRDVYKRQIPLSPTLVWFQQL